MQWQICGDIHSLWRYPVKSLQGEKLDFVEVEKRGVLGDRIFSLMDSAGKIGSGKSTRRFTRIDGLLNLKSFTEFNQVYIGFPSDECLALDNTKLNRKLSQYLQQEVHVSMEAQTSHFDEGAVHIITTSSLELLNEGNLNEMVPRFRPNIVLSIGRSDSDLVGSKLRMGEVELEVTHQTERCRMISLPQKDLKPNPSILKKITQEYCLKFGVYAKVISPGKISQNDVVQIYS